ncbi:MAG: LON peptidase substrate-binding domain-containing protein [Gemmatimonadaceae bacterium]
MDARSLPIFPLPLVLFPGVVLPLHIFEPRYRRMLEDALAGDRRFGIVFLPEHTAERELPAGHVGTMAEIQTAERLPDGRSTIIVRGVERFALRRWMASPSPYHVAEVEPYADLAADEAPLRGVAARVKEQFERVARAARCLSDDEGPAPSFPDDPALLAFRIAAVIDLDLPARQRLLVSRSPGERLREIEALLVRAVEPLERRAEVHERAKRNGHGPTNAA